VTLAALLSGLAAGTVAVLVAVSEALLLTILQRWSTSTVARVAVLSAGNGIMVGAGYVSAGGNAALFAVAFATLGALLWASRQAVLATNAEAAKATNLAQLREQLGAPNLPAGAVVVASPPDTTLNERFARALAHDLKGPARTLAGFLEIVMMQGDRLEPAQRDDFLERSLKTARRLLAMLAELEAYVVALGSEEPCVRPADMVTQTLDVMRDRLGEAMLDVDVDVSDDVEVPASLGRVLQNLLDNSVKYAGDDALEIRLIAKQEGGELLVVVTDNGMGFAPEQVSYIFEPFHRLDPHRERPGLGMGLALCRDVVSKYGGRIWATSAGLGEGATVAFRVPVHKHEDPPNEPTDGLACRGQRQ
jgi:signal transduction histidine kinase